MWVGDEERKREEKKGKEKKEGRTTFARLLPVEMDCEQKKKKKVVPQSTHAPPWDKALLGPTNTVQQRIHDTFLALLALLPLRCHPTPNAIAHRAHSLPDRRHLWWQQAWHTSLSYIHEPNFSTSSLFPLPSSRYISTTLSLPVDPHSSSCIETPPPTPYCDMVCFFFSKKKSADMSHRARGVLCNQSGVPPHLCKSCKKNYGHSPFASTCQGANGSSEVSPPCPVSQTSQTTSNLSLSLSFFLFLSFLSNFVTGDLGRRTHRQLAELRKTKTTWHLLFQDDLWLWMAMEALQYL